MLRLNSFKMEIFFNLNDVLLELDIRIENNGEIFHSCHASNYIDSLLINVPGDAKFTLSDEKLSELAPNPRTLFAIFVGF